MITTKQTARTYPHSQEGLRLIAPMKPNPDVTIESTPSTIKTEDGAKKYEGIFDLPVKQSHAGEIWLQNDVPSQLGSEHS
eukprot:762181-Hanusia_phi.AAC.8